MTEKDELKIGILKDLYYQWSGKQPEKVMPLPPSGSYRRYFRLSGGAYSAIGAMNPDTRENNAFIAISKHFRQAGLRVPEIYSYQPEDQLYLLEDLGDKTLIDFITKDHQREFNQDVVNVYKQALSDLVQIQFLGIQGLDTSICYPRSEFDEQSVLWDLNYFKHYFLKFAKVKFDEQFLEDDFRKFARFLAQVPRDFFLYRDFQSRNIMLHQDSLFYIDYQGGRRGALQYDVASLLFESKTFLPFEVREELLDHYVGELERGFKVPGEEFLKYYPGFLLIRLLQAMGAYGFRGLHENKPLFLESIPGALKNLEYILGHYSLGIDLPELTSALKLLGSDPFLTSIGSRHETFTLRIRSFSFKSGIPFDESLNGGGFVFDCRSLPNPGRFDEFKELTGRDAPVISFLQEKPEVDEYLKHVFALADNAIHDFRARGHANMMISFGCTGGRHRSVYCAEKLYAHVRNTLGVNAVCTHLNLADNL